MMARQFLPCCFGIGAGSGVRIFREKAWQQIKESVEPFSFWKSKFQVPLPAASRSHAEGIRRGTVAQASA